jgi:hypothetical protein
MPNESVADRVHREIAEMPCKPRGYEDDAAFLDGCHWVRGRAASVAKLAVREVEQASQGAIDAVVRGIQQREQQLKEAEATIAEKDRRIEELEAQVLGLGQERVKTIDSIGGPLVYARVCEIRDMLDTAGMGKDPARGNCTYDMVVEVIAKLAAVEAERDGLREERDSLQTTFDLRVPGRFEADDIASSHIVARAGGDGARCG